MNIAFIQVITWSNDLLIRQVEEMTAWSNDQWMNLAFFQVIIWSNDLMIRLVEKMTAWSRAVKQMTAWPNDISDNWALVQAVIRSYDLMIGAVKLMTAWSNDISKQLSTCPSCHMIIWPNDWGSETNDSLIKWYIKTIEHLSTLSYGHMT
jgi:hypothetical protein